MVSAFHAPNRARWDSQKELLHPATTSGSAFTSATSQDDSLERGKITSSKFAETDSNETEDEEVKMNCIGGVRVYMTSSDDELDDDSSSCCSEESDDFAYERGVVNFVSRPLNLTSTLYQPRAVLGAIMENDDFSDASSTCLGDEIGNDTEETCFDDQSSCLIDEESSDADDENSDVEDSESQGEASVTSNGVLDRHETGENRWGAPSCVVSMAGSSDGDRRVDTPTLFDLCSVSQGTPQICPEMDVFGDSSCDGWGDSDSPEQGTSSSNQLSQTCPKTTSKRMLPSLSGDDDKNSFLHFTPKRMRCSLSCQSTSPGMTRLYLGPSAYCDVPAVGECAVSPFSLEEEAEYDRVLEEELTETQSDSSMVKDVSPVPLLSPPPSPLCVESDKGQLTTMCEWPCNLAVDCALLVTGLRSHSPVSLVMLEEDRCKAFYPEYEAGTSLTPLLRGIRVNLE